MHETQSTEPWFTNPTNPHPYILSKKFNHQPSNAQPFRTLRVFPWDENAVISLWGGTFNTPELLPKWVEMIRCYNDAVAVGATNSVFIFFVRRSKPVIVLRLPEVLQDVRYTPADAIHLGWTLHPDNPFEPLLIVSHNKVIYIYNVERDRMAGCLQGHGGHITSVAVHPTTAHIFCTTSQDFTTRIYDLSLSPGGEASNPHWPPSLMPSNAGPAHGLQVTEAKRNGYGRCIIVLVGGRSGGHQAAVLGAAFHPYLPIIATCGLDRAIKIWFIRPTSDTKLTREDKPLFSSTRVHKARVLSVTWLQADLLLSHSAPALMRKNGNELYLEPGQVVLWRWLGISRFFPPDQGEEVKQDVLRGCASDYQESASFKIISNSSLPPVGDQSLTAKLSIYHSPRHDPLVAITLPNAPPVMLFNVSHLTPRKKPTLPLDDGLLVEATKRIRLGVGVDGTLPINVPPELKGWDITLPDSSAQLSDCAIGTGGAFIVAADNVGSLWLWRRKLGALSQ